MPWPFACSSRELSPPPAPPSGTPNAASDLERCDKPMGAVAVVEPQDYVGRALAKYQLGSPVGLIRLMVQQSNCFIVVERGMGMKNMMQERALDKVGEPVRTPTWAAVRWSPPTISSPPPWPFPRTTR